VLGGATQSGSTAYVMAIAGTPIEVNQRG